jgi:hypothetical protein
MSRLEALRTTTAPFGPWSPSAAVDPVERGKQFRSLGTSAAAFLGSGHELVAALRRAENDEAAAAEALALIDTVPSLIRRKLLSLFGSVTWPRPRRSAP